MREWYNKGKLSAVLCGAITIAIFFGPPAELPWWIQWIPNVINRVIDWGSSWSIYDYQQQPAQDTPANAGNPPCCAG